MKQSTIWFVTAGLCALGAVFAAFRAPAMTAGGAAFVALAFVFLGYAARKQGN